MNIDESGSMNCGNPTNFEKASMGAEEAYNYLREKHTRKDLVDVQIWFNDNPGVRCTRKQKLTDAIGKTYL